MNDSNCCSGSKKVEPECGVSAISLKNLTILIELFGKPKSIGCIDSRNGPVVMAVWDSGYTFTFTGFSWGYRGEGPRTLQKALGLLNIAVSMDEIAGWDKTNLHRALFLVSNYACQRPNPLLEYGLNDVEK